MTDTLYHKLLRVCALTLALVLLFVSGVLSPVTKQLSDGAGSYIATAIGMNASVLPNEINTLSAQLAEQQKKLEQREIAVSLKESTQESGDIATYIMSVLLFVLLVLIVLNYVLDFMRARQNLKTKVST